VLGVFACALIQTCRWGLLDCSCQGTHMSPWAKRRVCQVGARKIILLPRKEN